MTQILCLGRNGDCLNALLYAHLAASRGETVQFIISRDFHTILDGVSYVEKVIWEGPYQDLPAARKAYPKALLFQWYQSGSSQLTSSYQTDAWALAGKLDDWGLGRLVFDLRNRDREMGLFFKVLTQFYGSREVFLPEEFFGQYILVATHSISSPLQTDLVRVLRERFPDRVVIDLWAVNAIRPYDLLALMDHAACLVAVDTLHLHLARASSCPVISILNNGWRGSIPPPQSVAEFSYEGFDEQKVADAIERALAPVGRKILVVDTFGQEERHQQARETWAQFDEVIADNHWKRNTRDALGNDRSTPFLKDLLDRAMSIARTGDVIFWTNDDVQLREVERVARHAHVFGAVSIRRDEGHSDHVHIGRELYAFSAQWLRDHFTEFPDVALCYPYVDLVVARFIRESKAIKTTGFPWHQSNLLEDFFPCELPAGPAFHPPHHSSWDNIPDKSSPAARHNETLWWKKEPEPRWGKG